MEKDSTRSASIASAWAMAARIEPPWAMATIPPAGESSSAAAPHGPTRFTTSTKLSPPGGTSLAGEIQKVKRSTAAHLVELVEGPALPITEMLLGQIPGSINRCAGWTIPGAAARLRRAALPPGRPRAVWVRAPQIAG